MSTKGRGLGKLGEGSSIGLSQVSRAVQVFVDSISTLQRRLTWYPSCFLPSSDSVPPLSFTHTTLFSINHIFLLSLLSVVYFSPCPPVYLIPFFPGEHSVFPHTGGDLLRHFLFSVTPTFPSHFTSVSQMHYDLL